jgi:O-antigen/teichoic acid export membrane protein
VLLTPLYLQVVSADLYGAWLATGNILAWIQLVDPGLSRIMQQRVARLYGKGDLEQLRAVVGTGLVLGLPMALAPLLAWPFASLITSSIPLLPDEAEQLTWCFQLALLATSATMASFQPAAVNLGLQMPLAAGVIYVCASIGSIVTTIICVRSGYGLASIPLGLLLRGVVVMVANTWWLWAWCHRNLPGRIVVRRQEFHAYASLTAITFMERVAGVLVSHGDSFIAARFIAADAAAIYGLTSRGFDPARMVAERLAPAFMPGLAHLAGEGGKARLAQVADSLLRAVGFVLAVGIASAVVLNKAFVSLWVGQNFFGGQVLTVAIGLAIGSTVSIGCAGEMAFALGGVGRIEIIRMLENFAKLSLQLLCIWLFGLVGLPLGVMLGSMAVGLFWIPRVTAELMHQPLARQYARLVLTLARIGVMVSIGCGVHLIVEQHVGEWTWPKFVLVGSLVGTAFSGLYLASDASMRELIRGFMRVRTGAH